MNLSALAVAVLVAAQQPPAAPPQPVFRTKVELLAVDVSVVDRDSRPITGLTPADFTVEVGGKRRTVVQAEFMDFTRAPSAPAELADVSSNQVEAGAAEPRTILLLVDDLAFGAAEGKAVFMRLADQVDRLFPRDPLGFATLSGRGRSVEFTTDRKPVADALRTVTGSHLPVMATSNVQLGIQEAIDIARGLDRRALDEAVTRECAGTATRNPDSVASVEACRQEVETLAGERAQEAERESLQSVQALARVFKAMSTVPGTKYVLFVSPGIPLGRSVEIATALSREAAAAGVRLHAFYVEQNDAMDVSRARFSGIASNDAQLRENGLQMAVGASGGSMHRIVGDAANAIERVRREMSGIYRLGVALDPVDSDGKPKDISVKVGRSGAIARAFRQVIAPIAAQLSPAERLKRALQSSLVEREIGIRLATFVYRDESGAGRILVSAEADAAPEGLKAAYVVRDQRGKPAAAAELPREAIIVEKDGPPVVLFVAPVPPGDHTVKLALVDAEGRVGSATRPVTIGPVPDALELGDVLVLPEGLDPQKARPSARIAQGSRNASVYFELYGGATAPGKATLKMEVTDSPEGPPLVTAQGSVPLKRKGRFSRASGQLKFSPAALPPGRYFARLNVDGAAGVRALRGFTVTAGTSAALLSDESRALVPFFSLNQFLSPSLLGAVSGRIARDAGEDAAVRSVAAALEDGSWRDLNMVTGNAVADATLRGLQALSAGQAQDAERAFRDALDADPEFTLALALVGGAWASVGRDREASRSWRTSLATGIDAPFLFPFVAEALLRTGDVKGTREFVAEIQESGADITAIGRHRALASAISGDRRDAVAALTAWVDAHPHDLDAAFLLVLALYELQTIDKDAAAAQQFAARARHYIESGGPRRALVERWLK